MSLTKLAHKLITEKFASISCGIDVTCGNGLDTLFLERLCDEKGKIFSFDIQKECLNNARNLLEENSSTGSVEFINSGHENMEEYVNQKADIIMFNLGFLPNSPSIICTKPQTTIPALESSYRIVGERGMITILCYPGTNEGSVETDEVRKWINETDKNDFKISEYLSENPNNLTPVLYVLERIPPTKLKLIEF